MGTKQFDNYADLITFSRASSATYLDSDGLLKTATTNTPRIEYDADGNRLGLLIEEQRTNLLTYSEEFNNAYWTKSNASITANTIVAPDGTLSGDELSFDGGGNASNILVGGAVTSGSSYTISVFAKYKSQQFIQLSASGGVISTGFANFDIQNGTVETTDSVTNTSITDVGNGWYRCSTTYTSGVTSGSASAVFVVQGVDSGSSTRNASLTASDTAVFIWGAQFEEGAFPTSYIPTSGSTATRAADVASITGADFKKWFNADEGTLFAECSVFEEGADQPWQINDGTSDNRIILVARSSTSQAIVDVNDSQQANLDAGSITVGEFEKYAFAYKTNDFALSLSGSSVVTDTSGTIPVVNQATFASRGHIKSIKYYPRRLTNAQLVELTQ